MEGVKVRVSEAEGDTSSGGLMPPPGKGMAPPGKGLAPPGGGLMLPPRMGPPKKLGEDRQPVKSSLSVPTPGGLFPLANSPQLQSGSSTGNPRNKVGLQKGFSLMDWIRLTKSGKDLTGVGGPRVNGKLREVTRAELRKHRTRRDAWMAINGAVFNVTSYMDFHPGGWDELVKGVGKDATDLFNEVHRWVNYEGLLAACLVGKLVDGPPEQKEDSSSPPELNPIPVIPPIPVKTVPTFDYFQTDKKVTINIYSRRKKLKKDNFIVENFQDSVRIVCLFPDETGYIFNHQLTSRVESNIVVRVILGVKLEVDLVKETPARWAGLGAPLDLNDWFGDLKTMKITYRKFVVQAVEESTHDTRYIRLEPLHSTHMSVPPGHHIHLKGETEGMEVVRSYTPVVPLDGSSKGPELHLLIKVYPDGAFTPRVGALQTGDEIEVSDHTGTFQLAQIENKDKLYLIAAGTGVTPIIRLLPHLNKTKTTFLNFNKTDQDIIWGDVIAEFAEKNSWLRVQNVFSDQPSASGPKGRIRKEILGAFIEQDEGRRMACICGPPPFMQEAASLLREEFGFTDDEIHNFQG